MSRTVLACVLVSLGVACEPESGEDSEIPGVLEYEHPYARIYRLDRRIDIVLVRGDAEDRECGMLSERAHAELEDTLAALERSEDYGYDSEVVECTNPPGAWVHVEGFAHSPFRCDFQCCRSELARAALIYSIIEANFKGSGLTIDGEPYVAIEPDEACP